MTRDSCFTNHALDQFLEYLLSDGVRQMIRIGGRCKSSALQPLNLNTVTSKMEETKGEKSSAWKLRTRLEQEGNEVARLFRKARRIRTLSSILEYWEAEYPDHRDQLMASENEEGFQMIHHQRIDPLQR